MKYHILSFTALLLAPLALPAAEKPAAVGKPNII